MKKLISEGLKTDGSFQLKGLIKAANDRLDEIGKHGKRAKLKQSGSSIVLQFNFNGQQQKGINCSFTKKGIVEAEKIASLVTTQLSANTFSWEWFNSLRGKSETIQSDRSCSTLLTDFKAHWFKENKATKHPDINWYNRFNFLEAELSNKEDDLSAKIIQSIIEKTDNNTFARKYTINGLIAFLNYFDITDHDKVIKKYKSNNKPTSKKRNVPDDKKIEAVYKTGFIPKPRTAKKFESNYKQWQFLYSLLAVYGLRIHEAWNIANWDKPVILNKGDWVQIEANLDDESEIYEQYLGESFVIPAVLDSSNTDKILCIKHNTKTGYRMVMPLSPLGKDWIEEFNLLQPFNLPNVKNPLVLTSNSFNCSLRTCYWFKTHGYGFTAHDLRHAYNHRGHNLGYNPTLLSKSLGHSLAMNSSTYLKTMPDTRSLEMMKSSIATEKDKQSEVERLKAENEYLKQEIEKLKTENQLYKSLLEQVKLR